MTPKQATPLEEWQRVIVRRENSDLAAIAEAAMRKVRGGEDVTAESLQFPYSAGLNMAFFQSAVANLMFTDTNARDREARLPTVDWAEVAAKAQAKARRNRARYPDAFEAS